MRSVNENDFSVMGYFTLRKIRKMIEIAIAVKKPQILKEI